MLTTLAAFLGLEIKERVSRLITVIGVGLAALFFLIVAGVYLMGWVKIRLLGGFDPATADLILFEVFLAIAVCFGIAALLIYRSRRPRSVATAALAAAPLATTVARSQLPSIVKVVPLVIIGGMLLGRHFANRD